LIRELSLTEPSTKQNPSRDSRLHQLLTVLGIESLVVATLIAASPLRSNLTDPSRPNLIWIITLTLSVLSGLALLIQAAKLRETTWQSNWIEPLNWLAKHPILGLCILLCAFVAIVLGLSEVFRADYPYINQLMAKLGLLFYAWLLSLLFYFIIRKHQAFRRKENRSLAITLIVFAIVWILLSVTRIGLQPDSRYWNIAGVPILAISLAGILVAIIAIDQGLRWILKKTQWKVSASTRVLLEVLLVLGIWSLASLFWMKTPFSNSFFFYGPLPPDGAYLPSSDARLMDLGGQYLIIGAKLETPFFTEKPFYALFLGLLHFLFGQSYLVTTNVQILFLALFPVGLYLLGRQFAGWLFGVALAALGILKEFTALVFTFKISVSNSRLYMTEFPSALLLIITSLLLVQWLGYRKYSKVLPLAAGGVLGIACFVRSNNVFVFGMCLLFLFLIGIKNLKTRLPYVGFFALGALLVVLPWSIYTRVNYRKDPITWKVQQALFQRYDSDAPATPEPSAEHLNSIVVLGANTTANQSVVPDIQGAAPVPTPTNPAPNELVPLVGNSVPDDNSDVVQTPQETPPLYRNKILLVLGHFFNNQVKSLFVLPFQIFPQKPTLVLEQEYWREPVTWAGQLPPEQVLAFACNLVLISLGLSSAWKKLGWAGLVPLVLNLSYSLSNALVRTSGSRYLLPVDWTVFFYYLLGIWFILVTFNVLPSQGALANPASVKPTPTPSKTWPILLTGIGFLIIGLSLPLINLAFPALYHDEPKQTVLERLPMEKIQREIGISPEGMRAFAEKPYALLLYGKGIYPGYLKIQEEPLIVGNTFTLLTPTHYDVLIGDGSEPQEPLPAGEDMIVVGCQHAGQPYINAYLGYFVQSDKLIWATNTTFRDICP
jgi:hypothetical protein